MSLSEEELTQLEALGCKVSRYSQSKVIFPIECKFCGHKGFVVELMIRHSAFGGTKVWDVDVAYCENCKKWSGDNGKIAMMFCQIYEKVRIENGLCLGGKRNKLYWDGGCRVGCFAYFQSDARAKELGCEDCKYHKREGYFSHRCLLRESLKKPASAKWIEDNIKFVDGKFVCKARRSS